MVLLDSYEPLICVAQMQTTAGRRFMRDHDAEVTAGSEGGMQKFRSLAERALSAGGLHVTQGAQLWDIYRHDIPSGISIKP